MSRAYKCDRCGELFEGGIQCFNFEYDDKNGYAQETEVVVDTDRDFCPKCVIWALKEALKQVRE